MNPTEINTTTTIEDEDIHMSPSLEKALNKNNNKKRIIVQKTTTTSKSTNLNWDRYSNLTPFEKFKCSGTGTIIILLALCSLFGFNTIVIAGILVAILQQYQ